ncbi:MAG: rRNA maturation RNase YbeY [Deltaproteobacteria bacterium]|nr:rRNA maturation RNase YbeY [Deltaproteobacteria bacterium]
MGVDVTHKFPGKRIPIGRLKKTAQKILQILKQDRSELSLALVGNREIQELNARYRNKNEPTDVLSFPSGERLPTGTQILGDVVISVEQAEKQATKRKQSLQEEMTSLLVHGILHLLGYDHERSKKEAEIMRGMEKKIRRALCRKQVLRV